MKWKSTLAHSLLRNQCSIPKNNLHSRLISIHLLLRAVWVFIYCSKSKILKYVYRLASNEWRLKIVICLFDINGQVNCELPQTVKLFGHIRGYTYKC